MARPIEAGKGSRVLLIAAISIVVAALYFAQDVLIPVALAVLFCFLLTPLVTRLERLGFNRVMSVLTVVGATSLIVVALGWSITTQVVALGDRMPQYQDNIVTKYKKARQYFFSSGNIADKIGNLTQQLEDASTQPASQPVTAPSSQTATAPSNVTSKEASVPRQVANTSLKATKDAVEVVAPADAPLGSSKKKPLWVSSAETAGSWSDYITTYLGGILSPLATAGLVLVFVVFILLGREDLRDRMIRLMGQGQLHITTQAIDDATTRISRYLLAQAIVNGTYAIAIGLGLWLIGHFVGGKPFPTFLLWALLCGLLRFIPYIGPWIAAAFPMILSLAVYDGFDVFFWTVGMFMFIELLSNNAMEPWLYGTSTGMSTVAVLVSAVFWTWLWGPVGLFLSTPLTVCLVVMGKYVPQLQFLDVLLGDEPVLNPSERVYQRLLAMDPDEAGDIARQFLKDGSLESVYDDVLVPALAMAEQDRHSGRLDEERATTVRLSMRDLAADLADEAATSAALTADRALTASVKAAATNVVEGAKTLATKLTQSSQATAVADNSAEVVTPDVPKGCVVNVVCMPAHDDADEVVSYMLSRLLETRGYCAYSQSVTKLASEMLEAVETHKAHAVVISAIPPGAVSYSRYLCKRLHARFPDIRMVVGLWTAKGDLKKAKERVGCLGQIQLSTTLVQAVAEVTQLVQPFLVQSASERNDHPSEAIPNSKKPA